MNPDALNVLAAMLLPVALAHADIPAPVAAADTTPIATFHAEGAQIYECKAGAAGTLAWQFREPIATLFADGKTVGRHYAGPTWELADGSRVTAKVTGRAPGTTVADIPVLKLEVTSPRGFGLIGDATTIQRLATRGGIAEGPCSTAGALLSVPYSADYVFHRPAPPAVR